MESNDVVTLRVKVVRELPSSLLVELDRAPEYARVVVPEAGSTRRRPLRRSVRHGKKVDVWSNGFGQYVRRLARVPRSKVLTCERGTVTLPRWVARQAGLV